MRQGERAGMLPMRETDPAVPLVGAKRYPLASGNPDSVSGISAEGWNPRMSLRTLRRRVVVLETRIIDTLPGARLTPAEIADITRRLYAGESVTPDEMTGLKRHGRIHAPLMDVWF